MSAEETQYPYTGQPITPRMIEELVLELFKGRLESRSAIVEQVLQTHLARGGKRPVAQDIQGSVKKALTNLKEKGAAENPSSGYWKILGNADIPITDESTEEFDTNEIVYTQVDEPVTFLADTVVGIGSGSVYVYYLPMYRQHAEQNGEKFWPCKIGKSERDPMQRVLAQAATALPEKPRIALVIKSQTSDSLESAIHDILTIRGRRIDDSPGSEWFLTSPEEVLEIWSFISEERKAESKE